MRCISPLLIKTPTRRDFVPCGKCNFCLQTKRIDWSFRLTQEHKRSMTAIFLTLTYEEINLPLHAESKLPELSKRDLTLFTKRLRKENSKIVEWPLRYYSVGEYGTETVRPHYHSLMFNLHHSVAGKLHEIWPHGMIDIGEVTPASIHYVTKYVINRTVDYPGREPPFAAMSKRPGIGSNYLATHSEWHLNGKRNYAQVNGTITRLPRYYKEKIFSPHARAQFASQSLSQGDEEYHKEILRLERLHKDPDNHYDERVRNTHDAVTSKINSNNTF